MQSRLKTIVVGALSLSTLAASVPAMDISGAKSSTDIRSLLDPNRKDILPNLDVPPQPGIDESSPVVVIFRHAKEKSKGGVDIVWNGQRIHMELPDAVKKDNPDIADVLKSHFAVLNGVVQQKIPADKIGALIVNIAQIRDNFMKPDARAILDKAYLDELTALKESLANKDEKGAKRFFLAMNRISNLISIGADPRQTVDGKTIGEIIRAEPKIAGVPPVMNFVDFIDHVTYVMNRNDFAGRAKQDGLQPLDDKFIDLARGAVKYNDAKPMVFLMRHLDWAKAKDADADKLSAELKQSQNPDFAAAAEAIAKRAELKGDGNFIQLRVAFGHIVEPPKDEPKLDVKPIKFEWVIPGQDRQGR